MGNIDQIRQNKPSHIVGDLMIALGCRDKDLLYTILLFRGVFKWLSVRRKLITLKNQWKDRLKEHAELKKSSKRWSRFDIKNHLFIYERG